MSIGIHAWGELFRKSPASHGLRTMPAGEILLETMIQYRLAAVVGVTTEMALLGAIKTVTRTTSAWLVRVRAMLEQP